MNNTRNKEAVETAHKAIYHGGAFASTAAYIGCKRSLANYGTEGGPTLSLVCINNKNRGYKAGIHITYVEGQDVFNVFTTSVRGSEIKMTKKIEDVHLQELQGTVEEVYDKEFTRGA